jgi:DNA-binding MarR family transcriptional regulator
LNTLGALGYLRRVRDDADRRNVFVAKTPTGQDFLERFGRNLEGAGERTGGGTSRAPGERGLMLQHG